MAEHSLELLWQTAVFSGNVALLRVQIFREDEPPFEVWLTPNKPHPQVVRGSGHVEIRATLPTGTLQRHAVDLDAPSPAEGLPLTIVFGDRAESNPLRLHPSLGRLSLLSPGGTNLQPLFNPDAFKTSPTSRWYDHQIVKLWTYDSSMEVPWQADPSEKMSIERLQDSAIIHLEDTRFERSELANRPLRVFELRPPGFLSRFAILPPVSRIDAIIGKHDEISSARLTGGMTVEIVPFEGDISTRSGVHAAMSYVAIRAMAEAEGVAKQLIGDQSRKLAQFASGAIPAEVGASADPFAAVLAAYYLIQTQNYEPLGTLPRSFYTSATQLPDAALVYLWQLMTAPEPYKFTEEERVGEIKAAIIATARRGPPVLAVGLRFIYERLRELSDTVTSESSAKERFSKVISHLGKLIVASDNSQQFTTFIGNYPWSPTLDAGLVASFEGATFIGEISESQQSEK